MKTIKVRFKIDIDWVQEFEVEDGFDGTEHGWKNTVGLEDDMAEAFEVHVNNYITFEGEVEEDKDEGGES